MATQNANFQVIFKLFFKERIVQKGLITGGDVLENLLHFHRLQQDFAEIVEDFRVKGWLSEYQKLRSFSNPKHVKAVGLPLEKLKDDLSTIRFEIAKSLSTVYDQYTVEEWLQTYLIPFENQVCVPTNIIPGNNVKF